MLAGCRTRWVFLILFVALYGCQKTEERVVERPPESPPPTAAKEQGLAKDKEQGLAKEMIDAHNQERAKVGVPPLTWSPKLASYAEEWAIRLARENRFDHRPDNQYGENLWVVWGRPGSAAEAVRDWASEVKDYNYASNTCRGVCGHYTQVVWRNTKEVGCAIAKGEREVWVCNYSPPGNFDGEKPY